MVGWPDYVSFHAKSAICGLLAGRETERLGGTAENLVAVSDKSIDQLIRRTSNKCADFRLLFCVRLVARRARLGPTTPFASTGP